MNEPTRHASFQDYVRLLREQRWLIAIITVVCAAVVLVLSELETPTYQAQASLVFQDESTALDLVGTPASPASSSDQLAALGAQIAAGPSVLGRVKTILHSPLTIAQLTNKVAATAEPASDLVVVSASNHSKARAQALANAVANATVAEEVANLDAKIGPSIADLRQKMRALGNSPSDQVTRNDYFDEILHLQTLGSVAQPAQVSSYALLPTSPVSPKPIRNTAIGLLVGLMLGLIVAFIRDALNRRLRGVERIHEELEMPMLGAVPRALLGTAGPGLATGERKHLPTVADLECFRIMRANFEFLSDASRARTALVTSAMPGEGKSTVAAWLALTTAISGQRTLLLECDLRRPSLAERLGLAAEPGLTEFLNGHVDLSELPQTVEISRVFSSNGDLSARNGQLVDPGSLSCIVAGKLGSQAGELLRLRTFVKALESLSEEYDFVVLDSAPLLPVADTIPLLSLVDSVLLCVRDDQTTQAQARRGSELIARVEHVRSGLVATGIDPSANDEYGYYAYAYSGYEAS